MRLYQLTESNTDGIEAIYDTLMNECQPFYELSKGFRKVPKRMLENFPVDYDRLYSSHYMEEIHNLPVRKSLMLKPYTISIINHTLNKHGHASRTRYMMSSSSLGKNSAFPFIHEESFRVFPIGNFKYSYSDNDFNDFPLYVVASAYNHVALSSFAYIYPPDLVEDMRNTKTISDVVVVLRKAIIATLKEKIDDGEMDDISNIENLSVQELTSFVYPEKSFSGYIDTLETMIRECIKVEEQLKNEVHSDNYLDAFSKENEIWFNCKSYYIISDKTYVALGKYMMQKKKGQ